MSGSIYSFTVEQLEWQGVLHTDAHMFVQEDFYQAEPDVVVAVMTQLSMKAGLGAWGDKALSAVKSEMKQLHFRSTFRPKHLERSDCYTAPHGARVTSLSERKDGWNN